MNLAAEQLVTAVPEFQIPTLQVSHWEADHPRTFYQRGANGEVQIQLSTTKGGYWSQAVYQFSHEMGHVLTNGLLWDYRPGERNQWFEEAMCEAISLFVLSQMPAAWEHLGINTWYAPSFGHYRDGILANTQYRLPADKTMSEWLEEKLPELMKEHKVTDRSDLVATYLLPLILEEPKHLEAVRWMNLEAKDAELEFETYLQVWHDRVPEPHRVFVARIQGLFGYPGNKQAQPVNS